MKIYAVKILDISKEKLDEICLFITPEKKCRIERFINKKDKIRTLIGEILIRTIIVEEFSIRDKHIIFNKNQYGKPYLKDYPRLNFNISHSGDFVVCVVDDKPIGIDIEQVRNIEFKDIAERFFSASEHKYITKKDLCAQLDKFYEIWTLKESYIKCCGQGLSIPLESFSIDIDRSGKVRVVTNNEDNIYIFNILDIGSDYKMAVCSVNKETANDIIMIEQNNLIDNYSRFVLE